MSESVDEARSKEACPVCGENRLTLLHFPETSIIGVRPYDELYGMGDASPNTMPGIGCLACGSEWPDIESFRSGLPGTKPQEESPEQR